MHFGQYVFTQITSFLPKRYFERLVAKSTDRTKNWTPSCWNHLLVLMFGQLLGYKGLRELTDITTAHGKKSFISDSERHLLTRVRFPRQTTSGIIVYLSSLPFTWCSLHRSEGLHESLNCMTDSTQWIPQRLTFACRSSTGRSSGARSRA